MRSTASESVDKLVLKNIKVGVAIVNGLKVFSKGFISVIKRKANKNTLHFLKNII